MIYFASAEQLRFNTIHKCRHCGKFSWKNDYCDAKGAPLSERAILAVQMKGAITALAGQGSTRDQVAAIRSVCRRCGAKWPTFSIGVDAPDDPASSDALSTPTPDETPVEAPSQAEAPRMHLVETARETEPLGDDIKVIDNTNSNVTIRRRISIQRQWSHSVEVGRERETGLSGGANFSIKGIGGLKAAAERTIREKYAITDSETQTYTDEIEVEIGSGERLEIVLHWKVIWQHGRLVPLDPDMDGDLDYRVAVGITFDQTLNSG